MQLVQLQSEVETLKRSKDEVDHDRESEIRRIFDPAAGAEGQESNLSLENERLKSDLNQVCLFQWSSRVQPLPFLKRDN